MGQSALALGLQYRQLGMGLGALEYLTENVNALCEAVEYFLQALEVLRHARK